MCVQSALFMRLDRGKVCGMADASQTVSRGKPPSVDALKGLGSFDAERAFVWDDTPFGVFIQIQTAMTLIEAADMTQNLCHVNRSRARKVFP